MKYTKNILNQKNVTKIIYISRDLAWFKIKPKITMYIEMRSLFIIIVYHKPSEISCKIISHANVFSATTIFCFSNCLLSTINCSVASSIFLRPTNSLSHYIKSFRFARYRLYPIYIQSVITPYII